eukprot:COSAG02_NODE_13804_length_1345_cov_1.459069_1_plen_142_part_10
MRRVLSTNSTRVALIDCYCQLVLTRAIVAVCDAAVPQTIVATWPSRWIRIVQIHRRKEQVVIMIRYGLICVDVQDLRVSIVIAQHSEGAVFSSSCADCLVVVAALEGVERVGETTANHAATGVCTSTTFARCAPDAAVILGS